MNIYLDFDGTVVEHDYPRIGREVPHAMRVIGLLVARGHKVLLNTMRVELAHGGTLEKALAFINNHHQHDFTIAGHTTAKHYPAPWPWMKNDQLYIDDLCKGIPLIPAVMTSGLMVDWLAVEKDLIEKGVL